MLKAIARGIAGAVPALLRDVSGLAGAVGISYGAWLVYQPAGFIVGGALLLAGALLSAARD